MSYYLQGWCGSADPRKRGFEVRHVEAEDMKKEMEEQRQKKGEERQEINSGVSTVALSSIDRFISRLQEIFQVGVELVPLLKEMPTGKPRKDPSTGYLMNHSLPSTDVTKKADANRSVQGISA